MTLSVERLKILECMHRQKCTYALKLTKAKHRSLVNTQPSNTFYLERTSMLEWTVGYFEVLMITVFMKKL